MSASSVLLAHYEKQIEWADSKSGSPRMTLVRLCMEIFEANASGRFGFYHARDEAVFEFALVRAACERNHLPAHGQLPFVTHDSMLALFISH